MLGRLEAKGEGMAEDEIVRYHHQLNRHEFEQTLRDRGGQKSLECCRQWGHRVRQDFTTEQQQNKMRNCFPCVHKPDRGGND